jgi:hypothetical protein
MKVFISWSDQTSQKVATALSDWLPYVIQAIEPFVSSENIDKGERWSDELMKQLKETDYGIICVTRHNIQSAWMNFEAGALSKAIDRSYVWPFLFGVGCSQFGGPLQQFQFTQYGKEDHFNQEEVFKLISSMNKTLEPPQQVPHERLRRQFEMWWEELKKKLDEIAKNPDVGNVAGLKWLLLPDDVVIIQKSFQFNSIWIITKKLAHYSSRPALMDVVLSNMANGIQYVYIIPDSDDQVEVVNEFDRVFNATQVSASAKSRPYKVQLIPREQFGNSAPVDFIIVNPDDKDHSPRRVFLELPVMANTPYWIEVDPDAAQHFVSRFRPWAEGKLTNNSKQDQS